MVNLQEYLENKVREVIANWGDDDIYAISFFVYSNKDYEYRGYMNVTEFSVGYNTERDCGGAPEISEERWNYAFWSQNNTYIIEANDENEGMKLLFDWYGEKRIDNIGYEDEENCYDKDMVYIGKGPVGYYELLSEIAAVAKKLQESGFIKNKFGAPLPIIIHDLEYPWYIMEATREANSNGEAEPFLRTMRELGILQE